MISNWLRNHPLGLIFPKEISLYFTGASASLLFVELVCALIDPANKKTGFQLGIGANGWDNDFGMSGTFSYKGKLFYNGNKLNMNGTGTMNVDAVPCDKACVPLLATDHAVANLNEGRPGVDVNAGSEQVSVYPVPAHGSLTVTLPALAAEKYSLKIFDAKGILVKQLNVYGDRGKLVVPVSDLRAGTYALQLVSNSGKIITRKIVIN